MTSIRRGTGTTPSERRLARLAEGTFLDLWSYPNPHRDQRSGAGTEGKELCDLLVVCGDHVVLFSEKTIAWKKSDDVRTSWRRWYKKAIRNSAKQLKGARRWLETQPERVFVDAECAQRLPIELPPLATRVTHMVVVAHGAGPACAEFWGGEDRGSLIVMPSLSGDEHLGDSAFPFAVGDVAPDSSLVHVLDDENLAMVLTELDTVRDFTDYLSKKEAFIRAGKLMSAHGEEELVAYYLQHLNAAGQHDFVPPDGGEWDVDWVTFDGSFWDALKTHPQYVLKKRADEISYLWDELILSFTEAILAGESVAIGSEPLPSLSQREFAVREMALLSRVERRAAGRMIATAFAQTMEGRNWSMTAHVPDPSSDGATTIGFFFVCLQKPSWVEETQYRTFRMELLRAYALTILRMCRHLERIVGVASEPPNAPESSQELIYAEQPTWTPKLLSRLRESQDQFEIDRGGTFRMGTYTEQEYPDVPSEQIPESPAAVDRTREKRRKSKKKRKRDQSNKSRRANRSKR